MAKLTIVWSEESEKQKKDVLAYWFYRNKSIIFPLKFENEIVAELNFIANNPSIRKKLDKDTNYLRVREYWILYSIDRNRLYVEAFIDARQDPNKTLNQP